MTDLHIVLDTETTGLDPERDRIVEVACVELRDGRATGREFHAYVNPDRLVPGGSFAVHGLSRTFLARAPLFAAVAPKMLAFMEGKKLVIQNAAFDMAFLRAELRRAGIEMPEFEVIDTLDLARRKYPGAPANLNALCRRFGINLDARSVHGALVDCRLLGQVFAQMQGVNTAARLFDVLQGARAQDAAPDAAGARRRRLQPIQLAPVEIEAHRQAMARIKDPLWLKPAEPAPMMLAAD